MSGTWSGTWGHVSKSSIQSLVAMMVVLAREEHLLAWAEKRTEEKGRREDKRTPRSVIKTQMIHGPHILARVSSDKRC